MKLFDRPIYPFYYDTKETFKACVPIVQYRVRVRVSLYIKHVSNTYVAYLLYKSPKIL